MVEIAADDDVVVGPHLDDFRQIVFPRNGRDVELIKVGARFFFKFSRLRKKSLTDVVPGDSPRV